MDSKNRRKRSWITVVRAVIWIAVATLATACGGLAAGQEQAAEESGVTRTYYISADKVVWNYAPQGFNVITGQPFGDQEKVFTQRGPHRIGSQYVKCLYRGYTDASFSQKTAADPANGLLGPVIRAAVGDTIRVVFRNACPFPTGIHPHGVFYAKNAEGAPYNDGTSGAAKADDAVAPGARFTYQWAVPDRAGPSSMDASSVMWMYHGHTDEVADTYAGLMGPLIVTRRGGARADGSPADVDREQFAMFMVSDENQSPFLDENIARFAEGGGPPAGG